MNTLLLILISTSALAADLQPNARLAFDFPELPNTLAGMVSGTTKVARLEAILPSNYSPTSKHPLFVYLKGGSGGPEDGGANGAHTLSVLLAGRDEFITQHFHAFWLHEGGFQLMPAAMPIKDSRFLLLVADEGMSGGSEFRQIMLDQVSLIERQAKLMKADFKSVIMRGYGHDVPPEYMRNVRQFARGEPLEDITASEKAAAAKLTLPLRTHPDSSAWNDLLVHDLTNMKVPGAIWSHREGLLTATEDQNIWSKAVHGDCVLDLEFKFEPGANSGVFLYNSDETNWMPASIEIQICDDAAKQWQEKPANWRCGAFFGHQPASKSTVKPAGEWNRMTLTAQGPKITLVLNHEVVNEIDLTQWQDGKLNPDGSEMPKWLQGKPWKEMPFQGRIGFQGRHAGAGIEFRKVKVLRL